MSYIGSVPGGSRPSPTNLLKRSIGIKKAFPSGRVRLFLSFRKAHNKKPSPRGAPVGGISEGQGEIPLIGEMSAKQTKGSAVFAEEAASGEEKVSTNGRRMRGQRFLIMSDSVRLFVYRGSRKCRVLFVKMIFRISQSLIRLGIRRATFPPRGRLFDPDTTLQRHGKRMRASPRGKAFVCGNPRMDA